MTAARLTKEEEAKMSHDKIGPKERMLREMREQRFARKPSKVELRERVAKIKAVPKNRSRRGR